MGVGGQRQAPAALPQGKTRYPLWKSVYFFESVRHVFKNLLAHSFNVNRQRGHRG
jgi:hypothetical protein